MSGKRKEVKKRQRVSKGEEERKRERPADIARTVVSPRRSLRHGKVTRDESERLIIEAMPSSTTSRRAAVYTCATPVHYVWGLYGRGDLGGASDGN